MHTQLAINVDQSRPKQRRQLSGGGAAQKVHLKISVLTVDKAQTARQIDAVLARNSRHAGSVAGYRQRIFQSREDRAPVDGWEAGAQPQPCGQQRCRGDEHDEQGNRAQNSQELSQIISSRPYPKGENDCSDHKPTATAIAVELMRPLYL